MSKFTLQEALAHNAKFDEHGKRREILAKCETAVASTLKEAELHDEIERECRSRGWLYVHSRMDVPTTNQRGVPDFVVLADKGRTFLIECKSKTGKMTPEQEGFMRMAAMNGHVYDVVRSLQEFLDAVNPDKNENKT